MRLIDKALLVIASPAGLACTFMVITSLIAVRLGIYGVTVQAAVEHKSKAPSYFSEGRITRKCGVYYRFSDDEHSYQGYASFRLNKCPNSEARPIIYDPLWPVLNRPVINRKEDFLLFIQLNFIAMMVIAWDIIVVGKKK